MKIEFDYTVTTEKPYEEAVAVIAKAEEKGLKIQHVHDVEQTIKSKGFESPPLKIIEI